MERIEGFLKYLILKERSQTSYFLINNPFWHIELILRRYDVINYHWTGGFLFNKQYLNSSKVYWTLHDMNPFTGGCHYNNTCRQFEANCEECYLL